MLKDLREKILVIYEDADLVVIEKASGVITYPVPDHRHDSAIQLIRRYWKSQRKHNYHLYLLHRLDKDTSGLVVFAKNSKARKFIGSQFVNHSVVRQYLAFTAGIPSRSEGMIETRLARDVRGRRSVAGRGRRALTGFEIIREDTGRRRALLRCRLYTGRTHQIRIHLAHIGTPVVGDLVYGKVTAPRLALHAETLGFLHPQNGNPLLFRTSLPKELKYLLPEGHDRRDRTMG